MDLRGLLRAAVAPDAQLAARDAAWRPYFLLATGALGISVVVFLALVTGAACGSDGIGSASPTGVETETATPTSATAATGATTPPTSAAATVTPSAAATATPPGGNGIQDDSSVLPCDGSILAPMDKQHRLAEGCVPPDLVALPGAMQQGGQRMRAAASAAFQELFAAAQKDGFTIVSVSAYRSYADQVAAFNANVASGGLEYAKRTSALPGHSEHQLGTTTDVSSADAGFGLESFTGTPEARWIADNAWRYGFVVSYPDGKEGITGYAYESWHIRWLGKDVAKKVRDSGLTLHEYLLR
ncbi:MAG: M15 family metallopeptidase [Gemmataceae bacterium]|nr:M15 family metallopeptidase [Gemmataceae bacterium]